jgi:glycosyltransferase involved in cell wall biosynthesis
MEVGISVIICCYNSATRLPETIRHLAMQQFTDNVPFEIIIVNNNSNDNTEEIANKELAKYNCAISFKVINEPNPGLSQARKTGIHSAKYCYSVFCDDDNWLNPDYLQVSFEIMESNSKIGMLGGQSTAVCEIDPPKWFESKKHGYAIGLQGQESGDVTTRGYLWGAAIVLQTNVLTEMYNNGFISLLTDRNAKELSSGGDAEISAWFILAGYKLWYDSRLIFQHFIPKERLSEVYVRRLFEGFALASLKNFPYRRIVHFHSLNLIGKIKLFFKTSLKLILAFIYPSRFKFQYAENLQWLQLTVGGIVTFDSELASVQNMLRKPLKRLKRKTKS